MAGAGERESGRESEGGGYQHGIVARTRASEEREGGGSVLCSRVKLSYHQRLQLLLLHDVSLYYSSPNHLCLACSIYRGNIADTYWHGGRTSVGAPTSHSGAMPLLTFKKEEEKKGKKKKNTHTLLTRSFRCHVYF